MRKSVSAVVVCLFSAGVAYGQSNGNFSATGSGLACTIDSTTGALSGGIVNNVFNTNISTSNGNGVTLDIRPSFVTGLFTDTKISTTVPTATADVGIQVCVSIDGSPLDNTSPVKPAPCVTYDQRFQQISSQLFSQLTACTAVPTADVCSTNNPVCPVAGETCNLGAAGTCTVSGAACSAAIPCAAGDTCNFAGTCTAPNPLCNFELILSTLSAHSFDFIVPVGIGKPHKIVTTWNTIGSPNANAVSCVGPGITTITQVKVFNNSGSLSF